MPLIASPMLNV